MHGVGFSNSDFLFVVKIRIKLFLNTHKTYPNTPIPAHTCQHVPAPVNMCQQLSICASTCQHVPTPVNMCLFTTSFRPVMSPAFSLKLNYDVSCYRMWLSWKRWRSEKHNVVRMRKRNILTFCP